MIEYPKDDCWWPEEKALKEIVADATSDIQFSSETMEKFASIIADEVWQNHRDNATFRISLPEVTFAPEGDGITIRLDWPSFDDAFIFADFRTLLKKSIKKQLDSVSPKYEGELRDQVAETSQQLVALAGEIKEMVGTDGYQPLDDEVPF